MKITTRAFAVFLAPILVIQACGDNKKAKNYNEKTLVDQKGLMFIQKASESGLTEVSASMLAQEKAKNGRVIEFAAMMVADHSQVGKELGEIAQKQMVTTADTISAAHKKTIDSLSKLSGATFEKGYMKMMVKDHEAAVALFSEASSNKDAKIQEFARKTLPALKAHQDSAKAIYRSLK